MLGFFILTFILTQKMGLTNLIANRAIDLNNYRELVIFTSVLDLSTIDTHGLLSVFSLGEL